MRANRENSQSGGLSWEGTRTRRLTAGLCALTVLAAAHPALAQTASQVTPPSFEPQIQKQGHGIVIPEGAAQTAPAGAETLDIQLADLVIEGGLPALAQEAAALKAALVGKTVTAADLFAASRRLQAAYAAKGYPLVRVVLPAQQLDNGATLRIVVIDGFLEKIDTTHLPRAIRRRVEAVLEPLVSRKGITRTEIERRVLLAGDLPGTVLRSTLSQGAAPGGSILTIEARYQPVTFSIDAGNRMADSLGRWTLGLGVDLNSVFGQGELIYLRASGAPQFGSDAGFFKGAPRDRMLAAGVILPLGHDGLTLNLEASSSRTAPESDAGYTFLSDFTRYSARLNYPLIRSRNMTLNVSGAFDAEDERLSILNLGGVSLSKDRLRVFRTGADLAWYVSGDALLTAAVTGSFGVDGLGARSRAEAAASDTPLSRQGAGASFQKLGFDLGFRDPVANHLVIDLKAKAQTSFGEPLLNAEQIGLATATGLSAFDEGLIQGDDGFVVRGEAQFPFIAPFTLPFHLPAFTAQQGTGLPGQGPTGGSWLASPYVFGAYGNVWLHDPTALERSSTRGASYGVGLRLGAAERAGFGSTNVSLEFGRTDRFGSGPNDNRFTLTTAFQF